MTCSRPQRNVHRPGFEPGTPWSEIRRPNHFATPLNVIATKNGAKVAHTVSTYCFYMLILLRKYFIWLKQPKHWRKSIGLLAAYKPYTQIPENILCILVTFRLLWLQLSDTYRKFNKNWLKKGKITQNMKLLNVLEFVNFVL